MITINNFDKAYQHYSQHKIAFRLLQDQAVVLIGLCESFHVSVCNALEVTQADIDWLLRQPKATQNYDDLLGGSVYVCETETDLSEIHGCNFEWAQKHNGQWPNVTDVAMSWDNCSYLDEVTGDPQWVIFMLCWNNAGGHVYYVPEELWTAARVTEHIAATDKALN